MEMAGRKRRKLRPNVENNKLEESKTWSDLPSEISLLIFSRLTFKERTCASFVCKSWFTLLISARLLNKPPLLMKIQESSHTYELFNPATRKTIYLELPQLHGCWNCTFSIDGWLLVCQQLTLRVFFFNPYTQVSIELPRFNLSRDYGHQAVFSSSPLCHDCTVFDIKNISPTTVAISTCNLRSIEWTTNHYPIPEPTLNNIWLKIIFSNGLLYCLSGGYLLRIFDTRTCKWTPSVVHPPRLPRVPGVKMRKKFIAEHEGQIFLYCLIIPIMWKLDQTNGKWERIYSLDGVNFFMSHWSTIGRAYALGMKEDSIYVAEYQPSKRCSIYKGRYNPKKKYTIPRMDPWQSVWIDQPANDASIV